MATFAPESGDERWEFTVLPEGENEENLRKLIDAKARFGLLGVEFPQPFVALLFSEGAGHAGARVVVTLVRTRDEVAGTLTVQSGVHITDRDGQLFLSMEGTTEFGRRPETAESILEHLRGLQGAQVEDGQQPGVQPER